MANDNPLSLLKDPGFKRVWAVGLLANTMRWLEMLAIGIFVFEITGSALLVAVMTIARQLPLALFGSFIGPIAEKTNRKYLLLAGFILMTFSSGAMALMAFWEVIEIWIILVCVFINGSCWTLDYPVRRTLVGEFAGVVFCGLMSLEGAFFISATAYLLCVFISMTLILKTAVIKREIEPYLKMLKEGVDIVRNSPELIGVYLITIILNICGFPYASMVPVLGLSLIHI